MACVRIRNYIRGRQEKEEAPAMNGKQPSPPGYAAIEKPQAAPKPLAGKIALVTGSSRGIGAGIALELGLRGASVAVNYLRSREMADNVVTQIREGGGRAMAFQADVSNVPEIERLFKETKMHFGKIDIVASNSGMESFDRTEDISEEHFDHVFNLNFKAQFFVGQNFYKHGEPNGCLILMSSIAAGLISVGDHALYSSSKSAINGVTKSFAKDFGRKGMRVNAIAPGGVKSDMFTEVAWRYIPSGTASLSADKIESAMADNCPLGRCGMPADIARVVGFLASEDAYWINGQIITISGGSGQ